MSTTKEHQDKINIAKLGCIRAKPAPPVHRRKKRIVDEILSNCDICSRLQPQKDLVKRVTMQPFSISWVCQTCKS